MENPRAIMSDHDASKLITFRNTFIIGVLVLTPLKIIELVGGKVIPATILPLVSLLGYVSRQPWNVSVSHLPVQPSEI